MSNDSGGDRDRARKDKVKPHRNDESTFWERLHRFGNYCSIQFDTRGDENVHEDVEAKCEHRRRRSTNVTGSGDRDRRCYTIKNDQSENEESAKRRRQRRYQRCRRHLTGPRRRRRDGSRSMQSTGPYFEDDFQLEYDSELRGDSMVPYEEDELPMDEPASENDADDYDELPMNEPSSVDSQNYDSKSKKDSMVPYEEDELPMDEPTSDNSRNYDSEPTRDSIPTTNQRDQPHNDRRVQIDDSGACKCPPRTFSMENWKMKWNKIRGLVGRCYPALPCDDDGYYMLPPCPPVEDLCEDESDGNSQTEGDSESYSEESKTEDPNTPSDGHKGEGMRGGGEIPDYESYSSSSDSKTPAFEFDDSEAEKDAQSPEGENRGPQTIVCYEPEFWRKFFKIVILAPLLAFTAYLFVAWLIQRRRYNKKSSQLKKSKRQNEALRAEADRLEAYLMSAQMSPLANGKRQAEAQQEAAKISQQLNDHKQKMKELEEEKAVLLEVLYNLRRAEGDRGVQSSAAPIITQPDLQRPDSTFDNPM